MKSATQYNAAHADLVTEFLKVAPGCAGDNAGISVREVRKWQMQHGLTPDGKIGPKTIAAAKKESKAKGGKDGGEEKADVEFSESEAGAIAPGVSAGEAIEGGVAGGEEKRPEEKEDPSEVGGGLAKEGAEKIGEDIAGEGHGVAVGAAARFALVPHIVNLLRAHKFGDAVKYVLETVSLQERAEILKAVAEKIGGELSHHALEIFEHACLVGFVVDVLKAGWEWTIGGIKAVQEAHEAGDRDSRIGIYAWAWSDCVLKGSHDNPGAATEEQREAMKLGIEDGLATRDKSPELAFLLIAEYGNESNARHALEDALLKRAGISGIKTHAGR
ncbi:MAG TPA: peptidoglycan-binding domain-containing protein [Gemmatimonadales bacterium]|nr:peptidoglycan-binding domain-containing protein [Gemmatimonadales bacterium]